MSNAILSTHSINQHISTHPFALKKGLPNSNYFSEMNSAAISEESKQISKSISNLQIPLSPSSQSFISNEKSLENRLFDATASVKILTSQVAMHMEKILRDKLFKQIDLLHDIEEWDTDDKPVKKGSYATFLKALLKIKPQKHPGLGITYDGYLVAAWSTGNDRLTAEFQPNDRVRWVLTRNLDGEVERSTGQTTVSRLYECLLPYQPDHWFFE